MSMGLMGPAKKMAWMREEKKSPAPSECAYLAYPLMGMGVPGVEDALTSDYLDNVTIPTRAPKTSEFTSFRRPQGGGI